MNDNVNPAHMTPATASTATSLDHYWMPFTANRYFKAHPKLVSKAEGSYLTLADGRKVFDCLSGLWCSPLGHAHPKVVETVKRQAETVDFCAPFQVANPWAHQLAGKIAGMAPSGMNRVFFTNSGSEAVDTALKIAMAYHRLRGEAGRTRFIGRERGYHGVGFGGISVGGLGPNRKMFSPLTLPGVDHLPHTYNPKEMAFTRGQPAWGAHLADELERIVTLHDASNIAAVIVEPFAGSTGILVPPVGYLQKLREICTKHGILLIFDEVITGFGRLGSNFGAQHYGVTPDLMTFAKQVTNGVIPMGGVIAKQEIYDTFMTGPEHAIEFSHGYTYSGHPMAAAVGLTVLDVMRQDGLIQRAAEMAPVIEDAFHSLKGEPGIIDIRNAGLSAAVELEPIAGKPGLRALNLFEAAIDEGQLYRAAGDTLAVAPPYLVSKDEIGRMVDTIRKLVRKL
jgi:beta-alanine--pyruvate transaminase